MEQETHIHVQHTTGPKMYVHKHTRMQGRYVLLYVNTCSTV